MNRKPPRSDQPGGFLGSHMAEAARHAASPDIEPPDAAEIWATRIGRGLALIALPLLAWYFGRQLNWW